MGMETTPPPLMSTLNPNASVFIPAALRVRAELSKTTPADVVILPPTFDHVVTEPYSLEWWHFMETDLAFRQQYFSMCSSEHERTFLSEELDVSADSDDFFSYQEQLVLREEEEELARNLAHIDFYSDEDLSLTATNSCKDVKSLKPQPQVPWSKNFNQYQNKAMSYRGGPPRKANTYHRIHQPRSDM